MKNQLDGLSDPTKFHEPVSIDNIDTNTLKKDVEVYDYYKKD